MEATRKIGIVASAVATARPADAGKIEAWWESVRKA
jgi:hypothetical protein